MRAWDKGAEGDRKGGERAWGWGVPAEPGDTSGRGKTVHNQQSSGFDI